MSDMQFLVLASLLAANACANLAPGYYPLALAQAVNGAGTAFLVGAILLIIFVKL